MTYLVPKRWRTRDSVRSGGRGHGRSRHLWWDDKLENF